MAKKEEIIENNIIIKNIFNSYIDSKIYCFTCIK